MEHRADIDRAVDRLTAYGLEKVRGVSFHVRPGEILTWIGKILNPLFLICLGILLVSALAMPMGHVASIAPEGGYVRQEPGKRFSLNIIQK